MKQISIIMISLLLLLITVNCKEDKEDSGIELAILALASGNRGGGTAATTATTFTLGGTVTGLGSEKTLVLTNDGVDKSITANGEYTFDTAVNSGSSYEVTVKTQPTGQTCTVSNGTGTASANVSNINVSCGAPCTEGRPGGTETYDWGTFTDQCDGTIELITKTGTFGGNGYVNQHLYFAKCTHGQTYNSTTNDCTNTGAAGDNYGATQVQFCNANDNSCNGGTDTGTLNGSGSSEAWTACNGAGQRVPTKNELKTLIHCNDKTMPDDFAGCGMGNFTSPSISSLFPNTPTSGVYYSSTSQTAILAWYVSFGGGQTIASQKDVQQFLRCVSEPD